MVLFGLVLFFFSSDTNSILFHLVVENLIFLLFLIIMIIMPCSGMFRNVPGCSGMFHVPDFIDARTKNTYNRFHIASFKRFSSDHMSSTMISLMNEGRNKLKRNRNSSRKCHFHSHK